MDTQRDYILRKHKLKVLTGLSVSVAGVRLAMVQDPKSKTATMVQEGEPVVDALGADVANAAVSAAREFLALRARRFLGPQWKIKD